MKKLIIIIIVAIALTSCGILPAGGGYQSVKGCPTYAFQ